MSSNSKSVPSSCRRHAAAAATRRIACCASPPTTPLTAGRPRLRIPAFSVAINSSVLPSWRVWSNEMLVMIDSAGRTTLVESSRPPMPDLEHDRADAATGEMEQAHRRGDLEERRPAIAVVRVVALELLGDLPHLIDQRRPAPSERRVCHRCVNRSSRRCRCGEQYRPVLTPEAVSAAAIITAVEPLPLVPAMWMIGKPAWGSPSLRSSRRIRPSFRSAGTLGIPNHS